MFDEKLFAKYSIGENSDLLVDLLNKNGYKLKLTSEDTKDPVEVLSLYKEKKQCTFEKNGEEDLIMYQAITPLGSQILTCVYNENIHCSMESKRIGSLIFPGDSSWCLSLNIFLSSDAGRIITNVNFNEQNELQAGTSRYYNSDSLTFFESFLADEEPPEYVTPDAEISFDNNFPYESCLDMNKMLDLLGVKPISQEPGKGVK